MIGALCGDEHPRHHGIRCDLDADHDGPHLHIDSNGTTVWDLFRATTTED